MVNTTASMNAALLVRPLVSLTATSSTPFEETSRREPGRLMDRYDAARVSPVYLIPGATAAGDTSTKELSAMAELLQSGRTVATPPAAEEVNGADILDRLSRETREEVAAALAEAPSADHFSPQNTADRIVSFVVGGFQSFEGGAASRENSAEARQRFVDFIRPAIDKGYAEALELLGPIDDRISSELAETRSLIGQGLETFAKSEPIDAVA